MVKTRWRYVVCNDEQETVLPVSYTHLTLPTKLEV